MSEALFWICIGGILYPYFGYPALLWLIGRVRSGASQHGAHAALPPVTIMIPAHNEVSRIQRKIDNTRRLDYPRDRVQVLFISDGSTDGTVEALTAAAGEGVEVLELPARRGKAAALNAGLSRAVNEIVVFTDASIELEPDALRQLVRQFQDPEVGCVSGEDRIAESGGEAWYGRYELMVRRLESAVSSIAGASGSIYAQRRQLCQPFAEGLAPDFLSVLLTVRAGYRAVSEPLAVGSMTSVKDPRQEFDRKVRTVLRGMAALFAHAALLNPFRSGTFAFVLWSHKIARWLAPVFLAGALLANAALMTSPFYLLVLSGQLLFYLAAILAYAEIAVIRNTLPGKLALYFVTVNAAILLAWVRYLNGTRQEIWMPSQR